MSLELDAQNQFVLVSSLVLHHTAKNFPFEVSLSKDKILDFFDEHGINSIIKDMDKSFNPTLNWLNNEGYIRRSTDDKDSYTITEKGLTVTQFKVKQVPSWFEQYIATKEGNEYFFKYNDRQYDIAKLKCTGPALNLLPENWLQADE